MIRLLDAGETDAAAMLHRRAGTLIPDHDSTAQPIEDTRLLYRQARAHGALWGAFADGVLVGHIALEPGWIEHLYVDLPVQGQGVGRSLIAAAQAAQDDLQLWTHQSNARARRIYEAAGFAAVEFGIDPTSPRQAPNVRYRWRRPVSAAPLLRRLRADETDAAAHIHRTAALLIPGYRHDHSPAEDRGYYRDTVFRKGPIWGAFRDGRLIGHIALSAGWIDHLYVDPARHGSGIGRALVERAQAEQSDLQLYTFQSNVRARRFYAANGFVEEELGDGSSNDEGLPDVRLRWRRA